MFERILSKEGSANQLNMYEKLKIGVVGISRGVGTTFVASALARSLVSATARKVAYIELTKNIEKPLIYDSFGMDKRFAGREFKDFYEEIKNGKNIKSLTNIDEKINWCLRLEKTIELTTAEELRLINNIYGNIIICDIDIGENGNGSKKEIFDDMDVIVIIVDPMPSKLIASYEIMKFLGKWELSGRQVVWIINKWNRGIIKKELFGYLKLKEYKSISLIGQEEFYMAEYNCKIPIDHKEIREFLGRDIDEVVAILKL